MNEIGQRAVEPQSYAESDRDPDCCVYKCFMNVQRPLYSSELTYYPV